MRVQASLLSVSFANMTRPLGLEAVDSNGLCSEFAGVADGPRESDVGGLSSAPGYCDTTAAVFAN